MKLFLPVWCAALVLGAQQPEPRPPQERAVTYKGKSVLEWAGLLKSQDAKQRLLAAQCLARLSPAATEAIPALTDALSDPDEEVIQPVLIALDKMGPKAKSALVAILKVLRNNDPTLRCHAVNAIGSIGPEAVAAVPALIDRLKDTDVLVRGNSALALGLIRQNSEGTCAALRGTLSDKEHYPRAHAALALWRITRTTTVIRDLIDIAEKTKIIADAENQYSMDNQVALQALGEMGAVAKDSVPVLIEQALHSKNTAMREAAGVALKKIDPEAAAKAGIK